MDLIVPFVTGLTTGGLSCLAVQGGLLASSIAHEVEQSVSDQPVKGRQSRTKDGRLTANKAVPAQRSAAARQRKTGARPADRSEMRRIAARLERNTDALPPRAAQPIILFLSAKLVAYTALGFLLGWLGSVMQLSAMARAVLQAAIGVFMVGTALRMFDVHPIFRYFALEPPAFVTRYIRRKARGEASAVTPLFLGTLTVLIPCGVTQAMMAVAIGTGSAVAGATTMFAFVLGTSPVFFVVAYLATRLGSRLEAGFMRFVAVVVLILGLVSVDAGLTLAGWPYSVSNLRLALAGDATAAETGAGPAQGPRLASGIPGSNASSGAVASNVVTINVVNRGYQPRVSHARPGQPIKMALVTNNTGGCARAFVIPSLGIQQVLPRTGTTTIDVPAQKPGSRLYFSCSMGMYSGVIYFDG